MEVEEIYLTTGEILNYDALTIVLNYIMGMSVEARRSKIIHLLTATRITWT